MPIPSIELRLPKTHRISLKLPMALIIFVSSSTCACGRSDLRGSPEVESSSRDANDLERDGGDFDGRTQKVDAQIIPVDARVIPNASECLVDQDCPSDDRCQPSYCSSSGTCLSKVLPNGTACGSSINDPAICLDSWCRISICGDGFVDENLGETCEDGNGDTTDSCINCRKAFCGDGYVQFGIESCDPIVDRTCSSRCTPIVCGDGVIDAPMENCEPSSTTQPCNALCRISDIPRWAIEIASPQIVLPYPCLLLTSNDLPIVVHFEASLDSVDGTGTTSVEQYDPGGDLNWRWQSDTEDGLIAYNATIDENDRTVIVGGTLVDSNPFASVLDPDGEQVWTTIISDLDLSFVAAAVNQNSEIIAVLAPDPWRVQVTALVVDPTLMFLDADGAYDDSRQVSISGQFTADGSLTSGVFGGDSRFFMAGSTRDETQPKPLLKVLDDEGSDVWDIQTDWEGAATQAGYLQALPTDDGDIIVLGTDVPLDLVDASLWLERFSSEGTSRWSDKKPVRAGFTPIITGVISTTIGLPMSVDAEGNIYLGLVGIHEGNGNFVLIDKYDSNGDPVWERPIRWDSGFIEIPSGLQVGSSGAIYLVTTRVVPPDRFLGSQTNEIWLYRWEQPDGS